MKVSLLNPFKNKRVLCVQFDEDGVSKGLMCVGLLVDIEKSKITIKQDDNGIKVIEVKDIRHIKEIT